MQSILRWSIENSTPLDQRPSDQPPPERKDLDPAIIDHILGKPDAVQMKEDMEVAVDPSKSEDERIDALDHLEMLIEQIDNANDLQKLNLWHPLHSLLTAESSTLEIKTQALWAIGTAVQNNPSAQDSYLSLDPLSTVLSFLDPSKASSASARAKAIYTISGLLKHNAPAVSLLDRPDVNGWPKLLNTLQDPSIAVRRKTVFLLNTLLFPTSPVSPPPTSTTPAGLLAAPDPQSSSNSTTTSTNILTPDNRPASSEPIHPNSHAATLQNPSRTNTSPLTLAALIQHGILQSVISSLSSPLPHGNDGENVDADQDYEEKAVKVLYTYAVVCHGVLTKEQKGEVMEFVKRVKGEVGGEKQLLERWNLEKEEYHHLVARIL